MTLNRKIYANNYRLSASTPLVCKILRRASLAIFSLITLVGCATATPTSFPIQTNSAPTRFVQPTATETSLTPDPLATNTPLLDTMTPTIILPSSTPEVKLPPNEVYTQAMTARKDGDYARAAQLFRTLLKSNPGASLAREAQFRLGEVNYLGANYANAVTELTNYLTTNSNDARAAQARFFLAQTYAEQKNYADAIAQMKIFRAATLTLAGDTDAQIGDWMAALGDWRGAIRQYDAAMEDKTLSAATRIAILNRAADAHFKLGEPGLAAARYSNAYDIASTDTTRADEQYQWGLALASANSLDLAIDHWQHAINTFPRETGAYNALVELVNRNVTVDNFQRGLVDYYAHSYDAAIAAFGQALNPDNAITRNYLALSYERNEAYSSALAQWDALSANFPNDKFAVDARYNRARVLASLNRTDEAVTAYKEFAVSFPNDARADDALWSAAWALDKQEQRNAAAAIFTQAQNQFPNGDRAMDALLNAGFELYRTQDYDTASARWQLLVATYTPLTQKQSALYWLGKSFLQRGNNSMARQFWQQASASPRTYYGWRALDQLKTSPSSNNAQFVIDATPAARTQIEKWIISWTPALATTKNLAALGLTIENNLNFRRGVELRALDRSIQARAEFDIVNQTFQDDPRALYALSLYYHDNDLDSLALKTATRLYNLSPTREFEQLPKLIQQLMYPAVYGDLVLANAKEYGFDPALMFGLIRQESGFNPAATSSAFARGLTQVIGPTGQGIASQLGVRDFANSDLYRPVVSVRFGSYYLAQTLRGFNGNIFYALMGYNGGPGNAAKWRNDDIDLAIENITLSETATYVRAVYSQYRQYQMIYAK